MNINEYQKLATDTCVPLRGLQIDGAGVDILHAAMGLCTEAGEAMDSVKKFLIYDKDFDEVNFQEELGDVLWYVGMICERMGWSMEQVMEANIKKLQVRFPEKYTGELVINRDLPAERASLESNAQAIDGCPSHEGNEECE